MRRECDACNEPVAELWYISDHTKVVQTIFCRVHLFPDIRYYEGKEEAELKLLEDLL